MEALDADALDTQNPATYGEKTHVTAFVPRRFVDRGPLAGLNANPAGSAPRS
ncbi:hypothetical protein ACFRKB_33980 [Streptomyces scopuliridis]|uniref:hypothetical protein n=1 Tax=Streptomyces scopuliridis TaxID=452529 RepID=UPI0036A002AB